MFVSASENNVKSLLEHNWMFRIEARTCKCEYIYIYNCDAKVMDMILCD